ncbi:MAG: DNA polymerase III subunit alpha, partial [Armatimonadota bacterium]|nr:DNA polymerase III subunit alpha [Armatimonadota bacterium]
MFVHLHVHSEFSFLDGATKAKELVAVAAALDMPALALTEHNNVASAVRFQKLAQKAGLRAIVGCELTVVSGTPALPGTHHLTLLAQDGAGYAQLCRILTHAHCSRPRGAPAADEETLAKHTGRLIALSGCQRGLIPALIRAGRYSEAMEAACRYRDLFGPENFFLELQNHLLPDDRRMCSLLKELGEQLKIPLVATNNVHYATREGFRVQDLLTCMRHLISLDEPHPERKLNAEYYLKSEAQMRLLFRDYPEAVAHTETIAARCQPPFTFGVNHFPAFPVPAGETAASFLRRLAYEGAVRRYGKLTDTIKSRLDHELHIINTLGFADYFLAVWDVVQFAKREGIRHAGRGSAADSAVAYCLGITAVDSIRRNLMFERFMNLERANMPDIDVDFDARRRDDVSRYVYQRYGGEHVATVCTLNRYRARLAIREVGKAMGFPEEELDRLAKRMPHIAADDIRLAIPRYPELRDSHIPVEKLAQLLDFCEQIADHPKFLGTHLGGLVVSREPLLDLSPLQPAAKGVNIVQFDKDDVEELGLIKLDLLCLRTLGAVDDAMGMLTRSNPA